MIEEEFDTLLPALVSQHCEDVLLVRSAVYDVIVRHLGIEHRKAVMMLASDGDVLHSGRFGQRDPFARAELRWIELRRDLLVFRNRNFLFVHYPFALTQDAVHSPMDEHSELCILKPLASSLVGRTRSVGGVTRRLRALRLALFLRRSRHLGWPHDTCKEHHKDQATRVQQAIA